ncbi:hypothetical protein BDN72DRAFT_765278 [Pluteus cervinus]|uniref:Uncharacterized protein n=1 Tax=Pluteus cervinus TaxID=181527 RepID=A0ACD3B0D2_9AGAR|nr:hypothetical protein BDN72DRAFT_765278 [Pluteus cervinus]
MASDSSFQPLQLKGEIMDLEFTIDTDHRKRRRNRTTQSCLNCHTSKRKCDRKRPCQRCIQLGLTGLCVYEIDDPALRDDPTVDENTRLRNRIAELESLVRELRGKPHPRWADSNFRDGDPNEKWHSRASKCTPLAKRRTVDGIDDHGGGRVISSLLTPIKTEPTQEQGPQLYRFSPSPPPMRYHTFPADVRGSSNSSFDADHARPNYNNTHQSNGSSGVPAYHTSPSSSPSGNYAPHNHQASSNSYSEGGAGAHYSLSGSDDGHYTDQQQQPQQHYSSDGSSSPTYCPCRTNPATAVAYVSLSQQLQTSLNSLRQYSHHPPNTQCALYRRMVELHSLMKCVSFAPIPISDRRCLPIRSISGSDPAESTRPTYANNTPTDRDSNEILSPLSASSGHTSFHTNSSGGVSPQEWNSLAAAGYNSYFPLPSGGDQGMYAHVMS